MSSLLARLGGASAAHPWRVVGAWVLALAVLTGLAAQFGGEPHDDYRISGSPSQAGADLLTERFPAASGADARVVVHGTPPLAGLDDLGTRLEQVPHVTTVSAPRMSADGDTALFTLAYDVPVTDLSGSEGVDALRAATAPTERSGLQVELGGQVPENFTAPSGTAEAIGVLAALVVLVLAFGSVVAAGLPLAVALAGLGAGFAGIGLLGAVTDVSTSAPTVASMVGLGVGIDYALLLVTRYAEGLRSGLAVRDAAARASGTAGLSVLFAGVTVIACLLGLRLTGLATYASFGYATLLTVVATVVAALTLVPALCGLAGRRVLRRRDRTAPTSRAHADLEKTATARWAARVGRRPLPYALVALVVLLVLAAPTLAMRTWPQDAGSQPADTTVRTAFDLVAAEYGPGANGPLLVVADLTRGPSVDALAGRLRGEPGVAAVAPAQLDAAGRTAVLPVQPTTGPSDEATADLVRRLQADLPPGVEVTGLTAVFVDFSERVGDRLWVVVGFVVALSLVLLTLLFRSPVVAVKAAAMNLLSVGAAYGIMVAVFQWGWGTALLGLPHATPVSSFVPVLMFAILFGLSMDYEVFLLGRVREDWLATGDAQGSVVRGLARTGRVITSAAAIMIAVFTGFAFDPGLVVKQMGVGLAAAVLIDATVVRMVLVPATMSLLGRANWWLPAWLDRVLPDLDVEGPREPAGDIPDVVHSSPAIRTYVR